MEISERASLGSLLSDRLRERADRIATEWLARLLERLPERPHDIFPERSLLNHVPELVERISLSLASDTELEDVLTSDILHELRLLAQLRRAQGYDLKELLAELEVLGEVVAGHVMDVMAEISHATTPSEGVRVVSRFQRVLFAMGLVGADVFSHDGTRQRLRRTEILASYSRVVTHELMNRTSPALLGVNLARGHIAAGRLRDAEEALARVTSNLERIDAIPSDLLAVSVAQERWLGFPTRREPLERVIRRSLDSLLPYAAVHGVALRASEPLPTFDVDAGRMQLVFVNLISNGIKYRDLDKRERWVIVKSTGTVDADRIVVDVEDNGIGIPREQLVRIFDDRFRAHSNGPYAGQGLGLAIAHEVLLQLGSRLVAESDVGQGTRFSFRLPIEAVPERA